MIDDGFKLSAQQWSIGMVMLVELPFVAGQWSGLQFIDGCAGQLTAIDEDSALFALKEDSVFAMVSNGHFNAIGVGDFRFKVDRYVVSGLLLGHQGVSFESDGE